MGLPPELDQLGAALTHAAGRQRARVERRRRLLGGIGAGLLVFATFTPSPVDPADQPLLGLAVTTSAAAAERCDQPRGQRFDLQEACGGEPAPQAAR